MSAGLELPRSVWVHGFVTYAGRKESKSEGVRFELADATTRHGPEPLPYFLLREVPWNGDGDVTWDRFDERYTTKLANALGSAGQPSAGHDREVPGGRVPARPEGGSGGGGGGGGGSSGTTLDEAAREAVARYRQAMDAALLHRGIQAANKLTARANGCIEEQAPWSLAKDPAPASAAALDATPSALAHTLATLSALFQPIMPRAMEELASRVGLEWVPRLDEPERLELEGRTVRRGEPLSGGIRPHHLCGVEVVEWREAPHPVQAAVQRRPSGG